jgi:hypothetical protein
MTELDGIYANGRQILPTLGSPITSIGQIIFIIVVVTQSVCILWVPFTILLDDFPRVVTRNLLTGMSDRRIIDRLLRHNRQGSLRVGCVGQR